MKIKTLLFVAITILICSIIGPAQQKRVESDNYGTIPDKAAMYDFWMRNDVHYIITQQERVSFGALVLDTERDLFIADFWKRRDPSPGTERNEFRDEHYRRITHANGNFGFGQVPGWRSERGRVYITFGKPDEVKQDAEVDIWTYYSPTVPGSNTVFKFTKAEMGDFRPMRKGT